jgi:hypothetical protein
MALRWRLHGKRYRSQRVAFGVSAPARPWRNRTRTGKMRVALNSDSTAPFATARRDIAYKQRRASGDHLHSPPRSWSRLAGRGRVAAACASPRQRDSSRVARRPPCIGSVEFRPDFTYLSHTTHRGCTCHVVPLAESHTHGRAGGRRTRMTAKPARALATGGPRLPANDPRLNRGTGLREGRGGMRIAAGPHACGPPKRYQADPMDSSSSFQQVTRRQQPELVFGGVGCRPGVGASLIGAGPLGRIGERRTADHVDHVFHVDKRDRTRGPPRSSTRNRAARVERPQTVRSLMRRRPDRRSVLAA